jgi:hypothetical protein
LSDPTPISPDLPELRVMIPYVPGWLCQETEAWGESSRAEFHDVSSDEKAYRRLLARLWHEGQSFVIVEHDILPPPEALSGFAECSEPWCCYPYPYALGTSAFGQLGCTRFSAGLLRALPDLIEESELEMPLGGYPPDWIRLAPMIKKCLLRYGVGWHTHFPYARHFSLIH